MGRLDDIVARNQNANRAGGGGVIGAMVRATNDPLDTPDDTKRKMLAWIIVAVVAIGIGVFVAFYV